jgi:Lar family restriction alleviation protein
MNDELLPCPFCGWANPVWRVERYGYDWDECTVHCPNCGAEGATTDSREYAAIAWNKRAFGPQEQQELDDLRVKYWLKIAEFRKEQERILELGRRIMDLQEKLLLAEEWIPLPKSLEYDMITHVMQGNEMPSDYRLCRPGRRWRQGEV